MRESLAIDPALRARWTALSDDARVYLAAFLGDAPVAGVDVVPGGAVLPALFARDVADGGVRIRAAFPDLARRVAAIETAGGLAIHIACEGVQRGTFFGMVLPTGRRVQFAELHELVVVAGRVVADRVTIDLGAVVRQIGRGAADARVAA